MRASGIRLFQRPERPVMLLAGVLLLAGCAGLQERAQQQARVNIERETGLAPVEVPETDGEYLGKEHRGYPVLYTGKAGDVWGRYVARLTVGEIGREVGGIMAFLTSSYPTGGDIVGSPLDRLLSRAIGQPLSVTMILVHGRTDAPRLDIVGDWAELKPEERLPRAGRVGIGAGNIYTEDAGFAGRILADRTLMKRLGHLRGTYIRVDDSAVTLFWAGHEKDFSHMINDHGGYYKMLNAFLDDLADIADALPPRPADG